MNKTNPFNRYLLSPARLRKLGILFVLLAVLLVMGPRQVLANAPACKVDIICTPSTAALPTPFDPQLVVVKTTHAYTGPGYGYRNFGTLSAGYTSYVTGISADGQWLVIPLPLTAAPDGTAWVNTADATPKNIRVKQDWFANCDPNSMTYCGYVKAHTSLSIQAMPDWLTHCDPNSLTYCGYVRANSPQYTPIREASAQMASNSTGDSVVDETTAFEVTGSDVPLNVPVTGQIETLPDTINEYSLSQRQQYQITDPIETDMSQQEEIAKLAGDLIVFPPDIGLLDVAQQDEVAKLSAIMESNSPVENSTARRTDLGAGYWLIIGQDGGEIVQEESRSMAAVESPEIPVTGMLDQPPASLNDYTLTQRQRFQITDPVEPIFIQPYAVELDVAQQDEVAKLAESLNNAPSYTQSEARIGSDLVYIGGGYWLLTGPEGARVIPPFKSVLDTSQRQESVEITQRTYLGGGYWLVPDDYGGMTITH